uniref:Histamine receptor H3 n=1 Tax=Canis lupus dingo TaxID=286419 RepID=A0A8C0L9I3_CANLU
MERAPPDGPLNASGALAGEAAAAGGARGFSAAWTAVLAALMALLIVATVLGNALVMLAFVADSSLRTQNNFFLLNLAISDFLVGAFCIPLYVPYVLTGRWPFSRGLCKLWLVVDYLLCTSSVFNIVLISYDRFLSVTRAVSYRAQQGDTRRAVQKMVLVWVLAFLLYGPAILSGGGVRAQPSRRAVPAWGSGWDLGSRCPLQLGCWLVASEAVLAEPPSGGARPRRRKG